MSRTIRTTSAKSRRARSAPVAGRTRAADVSGGARRDRKPRSAATASSPRSSRATWPKRWSPKRARRVLAEEEYDHERGQLQLEEISLLVAEARFERVRAAEVISAGLAAAYDLEDDDFAAQIADLEGIKAERAAWLAERDEDLTSARRDWQSTREALSKLTGGAQGSVWVS